MPLIRIVLIERLIIGASSRFVVHGVMTEICEGSSVIQIGVIGVGLTVDGYWFLVAKRSCQRVIMQLGQDLFFKLIFFFKALLYFFPFALDSNILFL